MDKRRDELDEKLVERWGKKGVYFLVSGQVMAWFPK
jgi:hypothetical protein